MNEPVEDTKEVHHRKSSQTKSLPMSGRPGQQHTRQRSIVENAVGDFQTIALMDI